jgi:uncharacterized membrane protein YeaQ/YmgE (transglycosylase-associated protein family)
MMIVGYVPYLKDTISGKTKPHVFSWVIGCLITVVAFGLQVAEKAGPGMFVTLSAGIIGGVITIFAFRNKEKDITSSDWVCLCLASISFVLWVFADQPVLSMLFIIITEVLSFIPTIRKSWYKPYSETLSSYVTNFFRFIVALLALEKFTFVAIGYPATWLLLNGGFSLYLLYRRKTASKV